MAAKPKGLKGYWPEVVDIQSARHAVNYGAACAFIVAAMTGAIAIYATFNGPWLGFDGWSIGDAILMLVVGWRIKRFSRAWAVVGLVYWAGNMIIKLIDHPTGINPVGVISLIVLLGFVNGARGAFGFHKLAKQAPS